MNIIRYIPITIAIALLITSCSSVTYPKDGIRDTVVVRNAPKHLIQQYFRDETKGDLVIGHIKEVRNRRFGRDTVTYIDGLVLTMGSVNVELTGCWALLFNKSSTVHTVTSAKPCEPNA